jgi:hypothetical protein
VSLVRPVLTIFETAGPNRCLPGLSDLDASEQTSPGRVGMTMMQAGCRKFQEDSSRFCQLGRRFQAMWRLDVGHADQTGKWSATSAILAL